jgi:hypothetical protein
VDVVCDGQPVEIQINVGEVVDVETAGAICGVYAMARQL